MSYEKSIVDDYQPTFHIDLFKNSQPLESLSDFTAIQCLSEKKFKSKNIDHS